MKNKLLQFIVILNTINQKDVERTIQYYTFYTELKELI